MDKQTRKDEISKSDGNVWTWWHRIIFLRKCILLVPSNISCNINNKPFLQNKMKRASNTSKSMSPSHQKEKIIEDIQDFSIKDERTNSLQSIDSYFYNSSMIRPDSIESESDTFSRARKMNKIGNKRTKRLLMEQSQGDLNFANAIKKIFSKFIVSILIKIISISILFRISRKWLELHI